jgi:hypothetical protein
LRDPGKNTKSVLDNLPLAAAIILSNAQGSYNYQLHDEYTPMIFQSDWRHIQSLICYLIRDNF